MTYLRRAGRECKLNFRSHLKLNWFIYIIRGKYWFYFAADKWLGWRLAKAEQNALHRSAACLVITLHDNHLARIFIKHRNYYIHHNEDKKAHINRRFRVAKSATASKNGTEALLWKQKVLKTILCTKKYTYHADCGRTVLPVPDEEWPVVGAGLPRVRPNTRGVGHHVRYVALVHKIH